MTRPPGRVFARRFARGLPAAIALLVAGCTASGERNAGGPFAHYPQKLSAWELFRNVGAPHQPAEGVEPYELNTPLFSDYALKFRFVRLPQGTDGRIVPAQYREDGPFDFPPGTVIAKTFAYPADFRAQTENLRLLETRLLIHEDAGWVGLPYIWNDDQTEAELAIIGGAVEVSWIDDAGGAIEHTYRVPNVNQCKTCHRTDGTNLLPIGPRADQMNRALAYPAAANGLRGEENQLDRWRRIGWLDGAPTADRAPRAPVWNEASSGSLNERARTWLDMNCAHCHNLTGSGRTSGLDLRSSHDDRTRLGIYKYPVAAGLGTGDRKYSLVPGRPDESILLYRLESTHPGVMMPEIGRSLVDVEAAAVIREWIESMGAPAAG